MALGIFKTRPGLGQHFAQPDRAPRVDLGPEFTPEQYESRHQFERGLKSFFDIARRQPTLEQPGDPTTDPALREYQRASQWLQLRDPERAAELSQMAAGAGIMAQRRAARPTLFLSGFGYIQVPALPPGSSYYDFARAGVPTRIWREPPFG